MKLVIYGKEDVEALAEFVAKTFGLIPNKDLNPYRLKDLPFDENTLGNIYKVVPIKNNNTVKSLWFGSLFIR
jgi:insulysin